MNGVIMNAKRGLVNAPGGYAGEGEEVEFGGIEKAVQKADKKLLEEKSYKTKNSNEVRGSGYVIHTLEAVLWAFSNSSSFEEGLLKVVNLGEDADTTGCIYGQLAGAFYGERKVPIRWVDKVKFNHMFYLKAQELLDCSET